MTTEDDFNAALDACPEDWQTRLVFADWLDERGDLRAEGYRALGLYRIVPSDYCGSQRTLPTQKADNWSYWDAQDSHCGGDFLCAEWFVLMPTRTGLDSWRKMHTFHRTRREAEDAAAIAFAKLPAKRRAELLATEPAQNPH